MRSLRLPAILALPLLIALPRLAAAESFTPAQRGEIVQILRDALKQDPSILRDAIGALRQDEARRQAEALRAQAEHLVDPADPVAGNPQGDVTIVEFFDTNCPYCRRLEPTMASLLAADKGVRLVYKDLPILGPSSTLGARALLAAQRQGGYERLRVALMRPGFVASESSLAVAAQESGLDWPRLRRDMNDPSIERRLAANLSQARALGISGTPALIVGKELLPGAVELAVLRGAVAGARTGK
jgi:protein-disulfide isomerase